MRSLLIALAVLILLGSAFYLFLFSNPPQVTVSKEKPRDTRLTTMPTDTPFAANGGPVVGAGNDIAVETIDPKTGKLVSKFLARKYEPQRDGTVEIQEPVATFFLDTGGAIVLRGEQARVIVDEDPNNTAKPTADGAFDGKMPSRGEMLNVTIELFETLPLDKAVLSVVVPNLSFDSLQFRIQTQAALIDGVMTAGDKIPVTVRGRDYDFDGTGLSLAWNGRDSRLEMLEIAHGKRLLVKRPGQIGGISRRDDRQMNDIIAVASHTPTSDLRSSLSSSPSISALVLAAGTGMLQEASPDAATSEAAKEEAAKEEARLAKFKRRFPVYRARFSDQVVVREGETQLVRGDTLEVLLRLGGPNDRVQQLPVEQPQAHARATADKKEADQKDRSNPDAPAQPLEVVWTGSLRVTPDMTLELPEGAYGMEVQGSPLSVERQGVSIAGHRLQLITGSSGPLSMKLSAGLAVEAVTLRDAKGSVVTAKSVDFDSNRGSIVMDGAGSISASTSTEPNQAATQGDQIEWKESARVRIDQSADAMRLSSAEFTGDVRVYRRDLGVFAQNLSLESRPQPKPIDTAATSKRDQLELMPSLDFMGIASLTASKEVNIQSTDERGNQQQLTCDRVQVTFSDAQPIDGGQPEVERIDASGSVLLNSDGALLKAGRLTAEPSRVGLAAQVDVSKPPVKREWFEQFRSLEITDGVTITRDDMTIIGESVVLDQGPDKPAGVLKLSGSPARVSTPEGSISGAELMLGVADNSLTAPLPGSIEQKSADGQLMTLAWLGTMRYVPASSEALIDGGVEIRSSTEEGRVVTITGEKAVVLFEPGKMPTSAKPIVPAQSGPIDSGLSELVFRSATVTGKTRIQTQTNDPVADRLSKMTLIVDEAQVDATSQTVTLPGKGRMLLEGLRFSGGVGSGLTAPKPDQSRTEVAAETLGTGAVSWNDSLVWRLDKGELSFKGDAVIAVEQVAQVDQPIAPDVTRLFAEEIKLRLTPLRLFSKEDGTPKSGDGSLRLLFAQAVGQVAVRSKDLSFDAARIEFDAATNVASASGDQSGGVELFTEDGLSSARFSGIKWDVATGQVKDLRGMDVRMRR